LGYDIYDRAYHPAPACAVCSDPQALWKSSEERHEKYDRQLADKVNACENGLAQVTATLETFRHFGGDISFYRKWDPNKDRGEQIMIGGRQCEGMPCPLIQLKGISDPGPDATLEFIVTAPIGPIGVVMPLQKGCYRELLNYPTFAVGLSVEDDAQREPRVGLVLFKRSPVEPFKPTLDGGEPPADWSRAPGMVGAPRGIVVCPDRTYECKMEGDPKSTDARIGCLHTLRSKETE
jgi:hypothetical protein